MPSASILDILHVVDILDGHDEAAVGHVRDEVARGRQGRRVAVDRPPQWQGRAEGARFGCRPYRRLAPAQFTVATSAVRLHVDLEVTLSEDGHHQGLPES